MHGLMSHRFDEFHGEPVKQFRMLGNSPRTPKSLGVATMRQNGAATGDCQHAGR